MAKLFIFDVDGTIVEPWTSNLLPGVQEWFNENSDSPEVKIMFATNQGGVGYRWWLENDGKDFAEEKGIDVNKFPTQNNVISRIRDITDQLNGSVQTLVSFAYQFKSGRWPTTPYTYKPALASAPDYQQAELSDAPPAWRQEWRKPNPGMLLEAMKYALIADTVMVGDSEDDEKAAVAAGVQFVHADEFFGRNSDG